METYKRDIQNLLRQLGVNGSYVGFDYAVYGIMETIDHPDIVSHICKGLYVDIASHFKTSVNSAERNIRTVNNTIWKYGDRDLLNEVLGKPLEEKPCNAVLIDAIAQYIVTKHRNEEGI